MEWKIESEKASYGCMEEGTCLRGAFERQGISILYA